MQAQNDYSCNVALLVYLTSALPAMGGQSHAPATLSRGKSPGTNFTGGWVGPRAVLDRCVGKKISCHQWGSNPQPSSP
jgi:hypothetical protein